MKKGLEWAKGRERQLIVYYRSTNGRDDGDMDKGGGSGGKRNEHTGDEFWS